MMPRLASGGVELGTAPASAVSAKFVGASESYAVEMPQVFNHRE